VPPLNTRSSHGDDDEGSDFEEDDQHGKPHSPAGKAKHMLQHTFSDSTSGLGVGVLGAIVGGLSAREVSLANSRRQGHGGSGGDDRAALLSTIVGAAVGGLGANAIEKRFESNRKKDRLEQEAWERKWGKEASRVKELVKGRDPDRDRDHEHDRDRDMPRDRGQDDRDGGGRPRSRELARPANRSRGGAADDYYGSFSDDDSNHDGGRRRNRRRS
jgi:hypothetical protein